MTRPRLTARIHHARADQSLSHKSPRYFPTIWRVARAALRRGRASFCRISQRAQREQAWYTQGGAAESPPNREPQRLACNFEI
jgi:hypothetical protein